MVYKDYNKTYDFQNLKQYVLLMMKLKIILLTFPIALVQVKAGNNSENLFNEIREIVYSLHQSKENTKKVYNNIIKSI